MWLVQYGANAFLGRFTSRTHHFARGDQVVVRTPRGEELGTILCESTTATAQLLGDQCDCDLITTTIDSQRLTWQHDTMRQLLVAAERKLQSLPVTIIDGEVLFDGSAILSVLPLGTLDLTPLIDELSSELGLRVRVQNLAELRPPREPQEGCGKPDCGQHEGGCNSCGGCSRGEAKNAEELTTYFGQLREAMEAQSKRRPLA